MAQTAAGPGGEIRAAFGNNDPPRVIYRDDAIRNLERNLTSDIDLTRGSMYNALGSYKKQQRLNTPFIRNATLESDQALSDTYRRQSPLQDLFGVGDYLSGQFKSMVAPYIDPIANSIFNRTTIGNMARGVGGNAAGSSYGDILRGRILGQTAADYGSRMMGMLPQLYPQLQNANQGRFQELLQVLPARRGGFEALDARAMNPFMAQLASLRDIQGLAMGQNALNLGNVQGYHKEKNWADRVGDVGEATTANINQLFDWAQQAASIYGSVATGGMGGMMGGGAAGGGGGGLGSLGQMFGGGVGRGAYQAPSSAQPSYQPYIGNSDDFA